MNSSCPQRNRLIKEGVCQGVPPDDHLTKMATPFFRGFPFLLRFGGFEAYNHKSVNFDSSQYFTRSIHYITVKTSVDALAGDVNVLA